MQGFEILVFRLGTNYYGIRIDQVQAMTEGSTDADPGRSIGTMLGSADQIDGDDVHRISLVDGDQRPIRIGGIIGMYRVPISHVRPIPALIQSHLVSHLIWAAVLVSVDRQDRLVFLLDFVREGVVA